MGHSSLLGTDRAAQTPAGRDTATLGPGDSSDSGSDLAGVEALDFDDPGVPVDVALRDDNSRSLMPSEALDGAASDASGTGERRSAAGDAGRREAADIGVDHVFTPGAASDDLFGDGDGEDVGADEEADLAFVDQAVDDTAADGEDDDEDGDDDDGSPQASHGARHGS